MIARLQSYALAAVAVSIAIGIAFAATSASAIADATPFVFPSATPAPSHQAQTANVQLLDAIVFLLGASLLGGVLVWWGKRIFAGDERS